MNDAMDLEAWTSELLSALGVDACIDVDQVLDVAADAAHSIVRPAAPLTTFIAGLAAGLAGGSDQDIVNALNASAALCANKAEQ